MPAVVVEYDPTWPERFEAIRHLLELTLGEAALAIEHVGSTAVPGLAARPIIDVDVALADYSSAHELRPALEAAGFRRALAGDLPDRQWYVRDEAGRRTCHLSLTYLESETWLSHRALRERLLEDPEARREYGAAKRRLAAEHGGAEAYAQAKTGVIERLAGQGWRKAPPRQPLIPRRLLLVGGLLLTALVAGGAWVSYFTETSRGANGLPDHRPIRAADLASRPEANLFYPGSTVLRSARSDQSSDPGNPTSAPAALETLLATTASPATVQGWYREHLLALGWQLARSSPVAEVPAGVVPAGEVDTEWRRGAREFFDLKANLDPAGVGLPGGLPGLLYYRVEYLVGSGGR